VAIFEKPKSKKEIGDEEEESGGNEDLETLKKVKGDCTYRSRACNIGLDRWETINFKDGLWVANMTGNRMCSLFLSGIRKALWVYRV